MPKSMRISEKSRDTKETQIKVKVNADGKGDARISTGIGFFDHMLEALAKHSAMDIEIEAKGDLHIDMHHTMEDVGIVLGGAVKEAITKGTGSFSGIQRFGHAYLPMDETLVRSSMDLCNRPYLVWRVEFARDKVGDVDTELFKEFFHAFAMSAGACLHVELLYGVNSHHIAEACFKSLARALRMAAAVDERLGDMPASTKGAL